jgi:hypothetical protein
VVGAAAAALLLAAALICLSHAETRVTANAAAKAPRSTASSQARTGREAGSARAAFVPDTEPNPGGTESTARAMSKQAAASLRPFLESVTRIHELRIRRGGLELSGDTRSDALFRQASRLTRGAVEELTVEPAGRLGRRSFLLRVAMSPPSAEEPGVPGAAQPGAAKRFGRPGSRPAERPLSEGRFFRSKLSHRGISRFVDRSGPDRLSYDHANGLVTAGFTGCTEAVADALATLWRTNPHVDSLAIRAGTAHEELGLDLRLRRAPRHPGGEALPEERQAPPVPESVCLVFAELLERLNGPERGEGGKTRENEVAETSRPSASGPPSAPPGAAASGSAAPDSVPRLVGTIRMGGETSRCLRDPETGLVFVQSTTETRE